MIKKLKQLFCRHVFKGCDLQSRDENGMVKWPCSKYGKVFEGEHGLQMSNYGKITGPWLGFDK
jgi:hypothetical protein